MPARSLVPTSRDVPGAPYVALLGAALAALVGASLIAWGAVRDLHEVSLRRVAVSQYAESVVGLRQTLQDVIISGRAYAITGAPQDLAESERAGVATIEAMARVRDLSENISAPERVATLSVALDTLSTRLALVRRRGPEGVELARELIRTQAGPKLVREIFAALDELQEDARAERALAIARADVLQRQLGLWLPLVAILAIVLAAIAVLLMRAQARARAQDFTRFRAIFDNAFEFIGLLSPNGTLLEANRTALAFAGLKEDNVLGKPFWDAQWWSASPDVRERLREAIAQAARG